MLAPRVLHKRCVTSVIPTLIQRIKENTSRMDKTNSIEFQMYFSINEMK